MDVNVAIAVITCATAIVASVTTTGLILWKGGAQAERVETSVRRIEGIEKKLDLLSVIPVIETRIGTLENVVAKMQSDHRELARDLAKTGERALRAEMASQHDLGG